MRTRPLALVLPVALSCTLVAGCSKSGDSTDSAKPASTADCPTENTRSFAKTRFVADLGLAAGTFHRWIYKPYTNGAFNKGADGRTMAIAKAVGVAALDIKLLKNAKDNAKANPTLCKAVYVPLSQGIDKLEAAKSEILKGNFGSLAGVETAIGSVLGASKANGLSITETTDESRATT